MKKHTFKTLLAAALLTAAFSYGASAKSTVIAWDKLPAAVQDGIKSEAGGLNVATVEKEMKDHKVVYEAKVGAAGGKDRSIFVGEDGKPVDVTKAADIKPPETKPAHEKAK